MVVIISIYTCDLIYKLYYILTLIRVTLLPLSLTTMILSLTYSGLVSHNFLTIIPKFWFLTIGATHTVSPIVAQGSSSLQAEFAFVCYDLRW